MSNIMNEVQKEIDKLEHLMERMRHFKLQEPKGSLKCHKKGARTFFYQLFWNGKTKKCEEKYIKKSNIALIKGLAQKHYYANLVNSGDGQYFVNASHSFRSLDKRERFCASSDKSDKFPDLICGLEIRKHDYVRAGSDHCIYFFLR